MDGRPKRRNKPEFLNSSYVCETGRNLNTRLTEHKRASRNGDANNHIALHHQLTNHNIDYFQRLTLESWYTNLEQEKMNKRLLTDVNHYRKEVMASNNEDFCLTG